MDEKGTVSVPAIGKYVSMGKGRIAEMTIKPYRQKRSEKASVFSMRVSLSLSC